MKTFLFLPVILVVVICSCNSNVKPKPNRLSFGIYETVKITEIPNAILDTLRNRHIVIEKDQQQSTMAISQRPILWFFNLFFQKKTSNW